MSDRPRNDRPLLIASISMNAFVIVAMIHLSTRVDAVLHRLEADKGSPQAKTEETGQGLPFNQAKAALPMPTLEEMDWAMLLEAKNRNIHMPLQEPEEPTTGTATFNPGEITVSPGEVKVFTDGLKVPAPDDSK